jgi:hypothetical protein
MIGYHKGNFLYIIIPKNGSSTFKALLINDGWDEVNLITTDLDLSTLKLWGHICDLYKRHTKGLARYLLDNPTIDIDDENIAKILINGMFDIHTASIAVLLGPLLYQYPIQWIPLDAKIINYSMPTPIILTGNNLTNDFFIMNGINIRVTDTDILNQVNGDELILRNKIDLIKKKFEVNTSFIEPNDKNTSANLTNDGLFYHDLLLYLEVLKEFKDRYIKKNRSWLTKNWHQTVDFVRREWDKNPLRLTLETVGCTV